ncbi:MAG: iron-sulfur cluster assembly accessory protein [Balneolaceae bacterium]|nr:iron-sulfur cluster assembly accessory protein [Balneolaceae bacterium]
MSISISEKAADRISKIRNEQNIPEEAYLRVGVVSGGCSGLTYELDFETDPPEEESDDKLFEEKGIRLIVDMRSFLYLSGTTLDFSDGLNGEGFHFHNPNASRTCSCGESFSI